MRCPLSATNMFLETVKSSAHDDPVRLLAELREAVKRLDAAEQATTPMVRGGGGGGVGTDADAGGWLWGLLVLVW